jgi:hypothetical protein
MGDGISSQTGGLLDTFKYADDSASTTGMISHRLLRLLTSCLDDGPTINESEWHFSSNFKC